MIPSYHRLALESLWTDRCSVTTRKPRRDETTRLTVLVEIVELEDVPCRISFSSSPSTGDGVVASVSQSAKLFIGAEYAIPPGSKITVTRNGLAIEYAQSGQPARYDSHQEITLELFERWA